MSSGALPDLALTLERRPASLQPSLRPGCQPRVTDGRRVSCPHLVGKRTPPWIARCLLGRAQSTPSPPAASPPRAWSAAFPGEASSLQLPDAQPRSERGPSHPPPRWRHNSRLRPRGRATAAAEPWQRSPSLPKVEALHCTARMSRWSHPHLRNLYRHRSHRQRSHRAFVSSWIGKAVQSPGNRTTACVRASTFWPRPLPPTASESPAPREFPECRAPVRGRRSPRKMPRALPRHLPSAAPGKRNIGMARRRNCRPRADR
mmetsp:Transcript_82289/g.231567  ORF Transcript_82289/g.231567 Transcript_82289/m.231567 type:complete len:260 (+) Transcript_82289:54-833(+)